MGLAVVELLMNAEDTFNIEIPDADAAKLTTVGGLYDYIIFRLQQPANDMPGQGEQTKCMSSHTFYRLRRIFVEQMGIDHKAVKLDCRLDDLIPSQERRHSWHELSRSLDWRLPGLERPYPLRIGILLGTGVLLLAALIASFRDVAFPPLVLLFLAGILFPIAACTVTIPLKNRFSPRCATVRDLVMTALQTNYGKIAESCRRYDPDEIWVILVKLIALELNVAPEKVTREARFYDDLGAC